MVGGTVVGGDVDGVVVGAAVVAGLAVVDGLAVVVGASVVVGRSVVAGASSSDVVVTDRGTTSCTLEPLSTIAPAVGRCSRTWSGVPGRSSTTRSGFSPTLSSSLVASTTLRPTTGGTVAVPPLPPSVVHRTRRNAPTTTARMPSRMARRRR